VDLTGPGRGEEAGGLGLLFGAKHCSAEPSILANRLVILSFLDGRFLVTTICFLQN